MSTWVGWVVALGCALLVGVVGWVLWRKYGTNLARKWHEAQYEKDERRMAALREDFETNEIEIHRLEARLEARKAKLANTPTTPPTADVVDIADEFRKLDLGGRRPRR